MEFGGAAPSCNSREHGRSGCTSTSTTSPPCATRGAPATPIRSSPRSSARRPAPTASPRTSAKTAATSSTTTSRACAPRSRPCSTWRWPRPHEMIAIAERVRPDVISLVPERRAERTTEGGLDVVGQRDARSRRRSRWRARAGIKVSLFINPELADVRGVGRGRARSRSSCTRASTATRPSAGGPRARVARASWAPRVGGAARSRARASRSRPGTGSRGTTSARSSPSPRWPR